MLRPFGTITRSALQRLSDKIGGGGADTIFAVTWRGEGTYTAPRTGWYTIHLLGAGGSGGQALTNNVANYVRASGGGSGAYLSKRVFLSEGQTISYVVGAGGRYPSIRLAGTGFPRDGYSGGDSSVTLPDALVLTAAGGAGGKYYESSATGTTTGGSGGALPSGGDVNIAGHAGGTATHLVANPGAGERGGLGSYAVAGETMSAGGGGGAPGPFGGKGGDGHAIANDNNTTAIGGNGGPGAGGGGAAERGDGVNPERKAALAGAGGDGAFIIIAEV